MADFACARCNWRGTDTDAETHARDTGHLRCIVCQRTSLAAHEQQTCAGCIARVRLDLADLVAAYTVLTPESVTAMTLLGDGTMQRHAHRYELDLGVRDEWTSDPLPVIATLASWEDFWRADYGDPAGGKATLHGVAGYLTANLDSRHRAAQTHPAFDEFAANVRALRSAVQHSADLADVPVEAEAECFDCGGPLLRTYEAPAGPIQATRLGLPWEGLTEDWTCGWCRRVYSAQSYLIGLRVVTSMWVELPLAAKVAHRSVHTVRSWVRRGLVTVACRVGDRAITVWWPDISDRARRHADDAQSQRSA